MAEKTIKVVIDGQEMVSDVAGKASGSLDGFMAKIPGWAKITGLLTAAFAVISKVVGEVGDFVMDSISAYDSYAAAQVKLSATSKLTGVSLDELKRVAKTAREEFGLSAVSAVELTSSVARFTTAAGATSKASGLMASALELGAASGLNATQVAEGLTSALAGNDEFLNRLGLSNPSVIWEKYRVANGLAKDQMDDTTKALAVMTEIMNAGSVVAGGYAERLESGAGQQERLNNRMDEAKVAFGAAIQPLRVFTVQGLTVLVDVLGRVGLAVGRVVNAVGVLLVGSFQIARGVVGGLVEGLGKLTGNKDLEEWGAKQTQAFPAFIDQLKKMEQGIDATGTATTKAGAKLTANTKLTEEELKKQDAAWKQYLKDYEAGLKRINDAYDAYLKLLPKLQPALQAAMQTQHIEGQNRALEASKVAADAAFKAIKDGAEPLPALIKKSETSVGDMASKLGDAAGAVLTVGENFGGLDDDAKQVLTSVKSIGTSMGDLAKNGLSFAGVTGMVGAIASIVGTMMNNDAERRQLTRENNTNLKRLTQEIGGLKLDITGDQFTSALNAFGPVADKLARGELLTVPEYSALQERFTAAGLSPAALVKMAKELGVGTVGSGASERVTDMGAFFRALGVTKIGKVGTNFADQLAFFRESQDLSGESGPDKFQRLVELLITKGGVGALAGVDFSDPAKAKSSLLSLFSSLNEGGVSASLLGKISGGTLKDIISEIIRGLGEGAPSGSSAPSPGGTAVGGGSSSIVSGGPVVPTKTLADVLDGVVAQTTTLGTYHTAHLSIATAHLDEARTHTAILTEIADNTRGFRSGSVVDMLDTGLEAQRSREAAERGLGASY
jgi:hypothetical protein